MIRCDEQCQISQQIFITIAICDTLYDVDCCAIDCKNQGPFRIKDYNIIRTTNNLLVYLNDLNFSFQEILHFPIYAHVRYPRLQLVFPNEKKYELINCTGTASSKWNTTILLLTDMFISNARFVGNNKASLTRIRQNPFWKRYIRYMSCHNIYSCTICFAFICKYIRKYSISISNYYKYIRLLVEQCISNIYVEL